MTRWRSLDKVALLGSALGILSLFPAWFTLRPNRLASGTALSLWDAFGVPGAMVIAVLWAACLLLTVFKSRHPGSRLGILAILILVTTLLLTGAANRRLLSGGDSTARVSLSGGMWLTMAGLWTIAYSSRKSLSKWRGRAIAWTGLAASAAILASGWLNQSSIMVEYGAYRARFWSETVQHLRLTFFSVAFAVVIGVMFGSWAARSRLVRGPVFFVSNAVQTIPSLALFGLLIAPLSALSFAYPGLRQIGVSGVGATPAVIALIIYSLLPIVQNTYTGLRGVDRSAVDAGRGMGMTGRQLFWRIEMPLAAPVVLEGIRTASVQAVGLTTVAAVIGAGGLGWFVLRGIGQAAPDLILLGTIPIIALAMITDAVMTLAVTLGSPKGAKGKP